MKNRITLLILIALGLFSCKSIQKSTMDKTNIKTFGQPQTVIYKTIRDFNDLVPVTMNTERTRIISYPAPVDLYYEGKLAKPVILKDGYLLDNRGISLNTVFLKYTYEEYSAMKEAPSFETMMKNIAEKYPFAEIYYCGSRYKYEKNTVQKLDSLIDAGFPGCKKEKFTPLQFKL